MTIIDICPCNYSWGQQRVCCGPIPHFDLSYWAHEKLAHPIQGKMMLKFRPVNCDTKEPVDARKGAAARLATRAIGARDGVLVKGGGADQKVATFPATSIRGSSSPADGFGVVGGRTIDVYSEGPSPGWSWSAYNDQWVLPIRPGYGVGGSNAGCFSVSPSGRLSLLCVKCEDSLKPFAAAKAVRLWIRTSTCAAKPEDEPPVYLGVSTRAKYDYQLGRAPDEVPCGDKTNLWRFATEDSSRPDENCGRRVVVPVSALNWCTPSRAARANSMFIELGRSADGDREICIDDVGITTW